jgi:hypothetical protein
VRLLVPADLRLSDSLEDSLVGFRLEDPVDFDEWAERKLEQLRLYLDRQTFNRLWCEQMIDAIAQVQGQSMLVAQARAEPAVLRHFAISPDAFHTVFVAIDRPRNARIGDSFDFTVHQHDAENGTMLGGSTYQVQIVPEPDVAEALNLRVWGKRWWFLGYEVVYVRVTDEDGTALGPADGAEVGLYMHSQGGIEGELRPMRYHGGWHTFWLRVNKLPHLRAGVVKVTAVARVRDREARKTEVIRF